MSLDGKIATREGDSAFSDEEDWKRVHKLRSQVDAIMVGINTILLDDSKLTSKEGRSPIRVVVDSKARTPPNARVITVRPEVETIIAVTSRASPENIAHLQRKGAKIIVCGDGEKVDLEILMEKLYERGIRNLLLEGGGNLNWGMLSKGLVDEIRIAIAPVIVGGKKATTLVEGEGYAKVSEGVKLEQVKCEQVGKCMVLTYKVLKT
ncbi:MAG: 2,5-diamino-6-(ribosylamino)-4(3H)-pyrimidinone 5'-phosphate reductase [Candidatus Freyarchaeota archaeon]|nr:2,5-diamino-6-(ribosylamino)-4(3H)-pyrimidinone 5'-phosphate reductase [Candidatus Jordarchaeia archaeon]MBS7278939.1 2,5-diamino-6-(ribosylamino)-4(3H)-pyrimidinone 5'-phosphate reductase [Candidatus Jordarchaeia archaeon]